MVKCIHRNAFIMVEELVEVFTIMAVSCFQYSLKASDTYTFIHSSIFVFLF